MSRAILGIDPGMTGGLCLLSDADRLTWEMPVYEVIKNGGKRKKIDTLALLRILKEASPSHVWIEQVSAQPSNGSASAFTYGFGAGVIETAIVACGIPFTYVLPQVWKKALSVPKDKDAARLRASQLMPDLAHNWSLKRQDGVAEAALIALYGAQR
ncbi:hypothetical protein K3G63_04575 [Hymenobacter sp. HSC-4F20]|uniref:hypothetical protein n=1 Tax=Hymenobacter sp. HSC-4F20 TaxID=2864135 RepID=UPI001C73188C|nr:hypothetical protein [Hymenobacter sp. HSC-4F20]MBX0289698.1 hypothetical protein [Hymenobacter sp. HSC-4F20]